MAMDLPATVVTPEQFLGLCEALLSLKHTLMDT